LLPQISLAVKKEKGRRNWEVVGALPTQNISDSPTWQPTLALGKSLLSQNASLTSSLFVLPAPSCGLLTAPPLPPDYVPQLQSESGETTSEGGSTPGYTSEAGSTSEDESMKYYAAPVDTAQLLQRLREAEAENERLRVVNSELAAAQPERGANKKRNSAAVDEDESSASSSNRVSVTATGFEGRDEGRAEGGFTRPRLTVPVLCAFPPEFETVPEETSMSAAASHRLVDTSTVSSCYAPGDSKSDYVPEHCQDTEDSNANLETTGQNRQPSAPPPSAETDTGVDSRSDTVNGSTTATIAAATDTSTLTPRPPGVESSPPHSRFSMATGTTKTGARAPNDTNRLVGDSMETVPKAEAKDFFHIDSHAVIAEAFEIFEPLTPERTPDSGLGNCRTPAWILHYSGLVVVALFVIKVELPKRCLFVIWEFMDRWSRSQMEKFEADISTKISDIFVLFLTSLISAVFFIVWVIATFFEAIIIELLMLIFGTLCAMLALSCKFGDMSIQRSRRVGLKTQKFFARYCGLYDKQTRSTRAMHGSDYTANLATQSSGEDIDLETAVDEASSIPGTESHLRASVNPLSLTAVGGRYGDGDLDLA